MYIHVFLRARVSLRREKIRGAQRPRNGHRERAISNRRLCMYSVTHLCMYVHMYVRRLAEFAIAVVHKVRMELEYSADQCHSCVTWPVTAGGASAYNFIKAP